jgi:hypothetical protein
VQRFAFILGFLLLPGWACAQVVVNHAALDQLAGIVAAPPPATAPPPAINQTVKHRHYTHKTTSSQLALARPKPAAAAVTASKGEPVVALPPAAKPAAPVAPKPAPPAAATILFIRGAADLPAGAAAALKPFCAAQTPVVISAAAPVDPADPSSAMRLAMMRAFAVRGALIACGTASANILPRTATSSLAKNPNVTEITMTR